MIDDKCRQTLSLIDAMTNSMSTEEQKEFAADFTKPLASFANPGTGKSHSIIKGLIMAQTHHRVPGQKINAMSFTREATAELKARYDVACKACSIRPTVQFNTFHSICKEIVQSKYPDMKIKGGYDWDADLEALSRYMEQRGVITNDKFYVKKVLKAIESLNHELAYDNTNVSLHFKYLELNMDLQVFQDLRVDMFSYGIVNKCITQGDIPTYALYVLAQDPVLQQMYKDKYKIMVVDEFQDMTKLYLSILAMISSNLIVIGDLKQQIYGFNGACPDIVKEYLKIFPNAKQVPLTQSFRCKNEIADFATSVYWPNDQQVVAFKGTGDGGSVNIVQDCNLNIHQIVARVKAEDEKEDKDSARTTMFLFRNNFSITPIAEELYQQGVLFRVKKFYKVMDYPIYFELSALATLASEPRNPEAMAAAIKYFPEFRGYQEYNNPYLKAARGKSFFDVKYQFREKSSEEIIILLKKANLAMLNNATADSVFNILWPIYEKYIIEYKWWKLEHEVDFYKSLVAPIITKKTFKKMVDEEWDKAIKITNAVNGGMGVKCYTMHSAKGLEADDVYILDADAGIFPNVKAHKRLLAAGCEYEAAKQIREERNLLYVGITRAKENCYITYYDSLTPLISNPKMNSFSYLDNIYASTNTEYDDVGAFVASINMTGKVVTGNNNSGVADKGTASSELSKVAEEMYSGDIDEL